MRPNPMDGAQAAPVGDDGPAGAPADSDLTAEYPEVPPQSGKPPAPESAPARRPAIPLSLPPADLWSLRSKLAAVLLVPLVTLIVMWILATWVTVAPGVALLDAQHSADQVGKPAQSLIAALQSERSLAVAYLAGGRRDPAKLVAQRGLTDAAVTEFRTRAGGHDARSSLTDDGDAKLSQVFVVLDSLPSLRTAVDVGSVDPATALRRFSQAVDAMLQLSRALIRPTTEDLGRQAQALMSMGEGAELLAREDATVSGALAAGTIGAADLSQLVQLIGAQRQQFALAEPDLDTSDQAAYQQLIAGDAAATLASLEDKLIAQSTPGAALPIDATAWHDAYQTVSAGLRANAVAGADRLVERTRPQAVFIFVRIALTGLLGLVALVVTALASLRVARSLLRRLAGLRQAALELSIDRLPRVVERLRRGEHVDVATEAPPLPYGGDEIGQVGHAFNALQRTTVMTAVAQADLRRGVNAVFLSIARRSQTLLHRQLSILDSMERRAEDPVELADLFRVDHLATRMRRHAEDLVILAGAAPGRGWRLPVPLVDVLRGGVSEIEDYARVIVRPVPDVAVTGRAVGDIIHLLAELIENATTFSPPNTKVTIGAEPVTHGLAVEIEDRGIGIASAVLQQLNARLADPPDFTELAERHAEAGEGGGDQLGLFVVARLAVRHGIQVQLRHSAYGGTTAVALLPDALLAPSGEPPALPAGSTYPRDPGAGALVALTAGSPNAPRSAAEPRSGEGRAASSAAAQHDTAAEPRSGEGRAASSAAAQRDTPAEPRSGEGRAASSAAAQHDTPAEPRSGEGRATTASTAGFTPVAGHGDPLPSRRAVADPPEDAVIVATTGRPPGRHSRQEVIEALDDGLPRRVRQRGSASRPADADGSGAADGTTGTSAEGSDVATHADDARSPEEIRAMMSSFQAGLARGRRAADEEDGPDRTETDDVRTADAGAGGEVADGGQPGTGTATVEAT